MDYKTKAEKFCEETGTVISIKKVGIIDRFPGDKVPTGNRREYRVLIERKRKFYITPFYGSANGFETEDITEYDILAGMTKKDPGSFWDFINKYGYTISSEDDFQQLTILYKGILFEYQAMKNLFQDVMEKLQEIY